MTYCYCDTETANETPISAGSYRYSETVRVQLWQYAIDDGPVSVWDVDAGDPMPADLRAAIDDESVKFVWHNQGFDRHQIKSLGVILPPERIIDTMVLAYMHSLPGSLDQLCTIFKLPEDVAKQKRGRQLVMMFCKPRPKNSKVRWFTRHTHPKEWEEYKDYGAHDVLAMREIFKRMPKINCTEAERQLWLLDQKINDRGFKIDLELVDAALEAVADAKESLAAECSEATDSAVGAATQRDALLDYIAQEHGFRVKDMRADTLQRLVESEDTPVEVKLLLENRLQASSTSVGKYKKIKECVSSDGRMRGALQFCGAGRTGRWSGRSVQPQNFPRPKLKQKDIDAGIEALKAGVADVLFPSVVDLAASALRGVIVAPPGKKLVVSDLSAIEGRGTCWLAGEEWRLEGFRAYDSGQGYDDYVNTYAQSFNIPPADVTKAQRQIGKVMVLMLGYGGNVGAFHTGAATYHLDLDTLAQQAREVISTDVWAEASGFLRFAKEKKLPRYGLRDETYIACNALVRIWRAANSNVAGMWPALEDAAKCAIFNPDIEFPVGPVVFIYRKKWLYCRLPSGRHLCYPGAAVRKDPKMGKENVTYVGVDQYTRKWDRLRTYGGKLLENICQGFSRDVLACGATLADAAGYEIVLSVHDELITETPDTPEFNEAGLSAHMSTTPPWAPGLPLAAKGFESYRYKKDD